MATVTRSTKEGGGQVLVSGRLAKAVDVETDLATLFSLVNGNLDADNLAANSVGTSELIAGSVDTASIAAGAVTNTEVAAGASIATSKLDDASADDDAADLDRNPGDHATHINADGLEEEIQGLRYALRRLAVGTSPVREAVAGSTVPSWLDLPAKGPNLIKNGKFVANNSSSEPEYWTKVSTPTTFTVKTETGTDGDTSVAHVVCDAADEGLRQVVTGLKASTRYLVVALVRPDTIDCKLVTAGALAASEWDDVTDTSASGSGSLEVIGGVVSTDATPTDITVDILGVANTSDFRVFWAGMYECSTDIIPEAGNYIAFDTDTTNTAITPVNTFVPLALDATVFVPGPGYAIKVTANVQYSPDAGLDGSLALQLRQSVNGAADTNPIVQSSFLGTNSNFPCSAQLHWVETSPVPGSSYRYRLNAAADNQVSTLNPTVVVLGNQNTSTLLVELIKMG